MNSNADLSILTLITQASPVVQVVLAILILLSLMSWTVIFRIRKPLLERHRAHEAS